MRTTVTAAGRTTTEPGSCLLVQAGRRAKIANAMSAGRRMPRTDDSAVPPCFETQSIQRYPRTRLAFAATIRPGHARSTGGVFGSRWGEGCSVLVTAPLLVAYIH